MLEKRFQATRTADALVDFLDLSMRKLFPARANGNVVVQSVEKDADFTERKAQSSFSS
jgi:hypothetical protein